MRKANSDHTINDIYLTSKYSALFNSEIKLTDPHSLQLSSLSLSKVHTKIGRRKLNKRRKTREEELDIYDAKQLAKKKSKNNAL